MFAVQLYKFSTTEKSNNQVLRNFQHVNETVIRNAFLARMTTRYAGDVVLVPGKRDIHAFVVWSAIDTEQRETEIAFWRKFIGNSRRKLAEAFNLIAPAGSFWMEDSPSYVDQLIPRETLTQMYKEIPPEQGLDSVHEKGLERLGRFLNGELKSGEILE